MKTFTRILSAVSLLAAVSTAAGAAPHVSRRPDVATPKAGDPAPVPCTIPLRYDDGTDDRPGEGYTLGWYSPTDFQFLGVRFTLPNGADYEIESASFFAEFWIRPGTIDVHALQLDDPSNSTVASIFVDGSGVWSVSFPQPICIQGGKEYAIMLCSTPDEGQGVTGEDVSNLDDRSAYSFQGCDPTIPLTDVDLMIWSCVRECGTVPATGRSWGSLKSIYR
jgi:hypothetical protein